MGWLVIQSDLTRPFCYEEQSPYEESDALHTSLSDFFASLVREVADVFRCSGVIYQTCTTEVKRWVKVDEQVCYG